MNTGNAYVSNCLTMVKNTEIVPEQICWRLLNRVASYFSFVDSTEVYHFPEGLVAWWWYSIWMNASAVLNSTPNHEERCFIKQRMPSSYLILTIVWKNQLFMIYSAFYLQCILFSLNVIQSNLCSLFLNDWKIFLEA